jgi:hypothetical protein
MRKHKSPTIAGTGSKAKIRLCIQRSSVSIQRLFLERYVSIVWTRRRVRDEQVGVKFALRLLVSSAKRRVQSTDAISSLRPGVCRHFLEESNSNFQLSQFESCAAPPITTHRAASAWATCYSDLRFSSSLKMMDSEISFMDLRIC